MFLLAQVVQLVVSLHGGAGAGWLGGVLHLGSGTRGAVGGVAVWKRWCWWAGWASCMLVFESLEKLVLSLYGCAGAAGGLGGRRACWRWYELQGSWCRCMAAPVVLVGWVGAVHVGIGKRRGVGGVSIWQRRCW